MQVHQCHHWAQERQGLAQHHYNHLLMIQASLVQPKQLVLMLKMATSYQEWPDLYDQRSQGLMPVMFTLVIMVPKPVPMRMPVPMPPLPHLTLYLPLNSLYTDPLQFLHTI